jgi:tetratricopeptide (TPR) repeat protein
VAFALVVAFVAALLGYQWWHDRIDEATAAVVAADEQAGRQQWQAAIDGYSAAEGRYPHADSLFLKRGRAYEGANDYDSAIRDYTAALAANPTMLEPLISRAAARLKSEDYAGAVVDFDRVIQRDSSIASAYVGRAAARNRLDGNADSSLTDLTRAYAVDSTRLDALFERGALNQRLGRRDSAVSDFRRVAATATNPNDRSAAQARLAELSAPQGTPEPAMAPRQVVTTVYIQYADPDDAKAVAQVRADMGRAGAFRLPEPELVGKGPSVGQVRFREDDSRAAKDVIDAAERALARSGYRIQLEPRPLAASGSRAGRIEIWLPSLSRSLYSVEQKK